MQCNQAYLTNGVIKMSNTYSQQFKNSSFVVRGNVVIVTSFEGSKFMGEVKIPLSEFLKAAVVITSKEGK